MVYSLFSHSSQIHNPVSYVVFSVTDLELILVVTWGEERCLHPEISPILLNLPMMIKKSKPINLESLYVKFNCLMKKKSSVVFLKINKYINKIQYNKTMQNIHVSLLRFFVRPILVLVLFTPSSYFQIHSLYVIATALLQHDNSGISWIVLDLFYCFASLL